MNIHVFVGPTLRRDEVLESLENTQVFGPAAFGDVYRSARAKARAILIIDGYFERVPAVWHKEILWAMSEGVHVFGASSMGALRAAELADFGMVGVGSIYEAYRAGALEDDDEVTIAHASEHDGFSAISEAMVNIRATVLAAVEAHVISKQTADRVVTAAKTKFYAERSYATALRDAEAQGADTAEIRVLRAWLPTGRIDQKAADARLLLRHVREWLEGPENPLRVKYRFEPTDAWLEATRVAEAADDSRPAATHSNEALEEELKLAGDFQAVWDATVARAATIDHARRAGFCPDSSSIAQAAEALRRDLGLIQRKDFEGWMARERIDKVALLQLLEEQARILWARPMVDDDARAHLANHLRVRGQYFQYAERARVKARRLAALGPRGPSLSDLGMVENSLWEWYFVQRLGRSVPDDLSAFARQAGFADKDELRSAVLRDLYCVRLDREHSKWTGADTPPK